MAYLAVGQPPLPSVGDQRRDRQRPVRLLQRGVLQKKAAVRGGTSDSRVDAQRWSSADLENDSRKGRALGV